MIKKFLLMCICFMMCLANFSVGFCASKNSDTNRKINLVWQPVLDDENDLSQIKKLSGVNIVSPSWFVIER